MKKNPVSYLTFSILFLGLLLSAIWLFKSDGDSRFEPALTVLGLFATITGIFAERLASERERKIELLLALYGECIKNLEVLKDNRFKLNPDRLNGPIVFPRLIASVSEAAIISGIFEEKSYRDVFSYLHAWRDISSEFNHRLDITELITFINPSQTEMRSFYVGLITSGKIDEAMQLSENAAYTLKAKYLKHVDVAVLDLGYHNTL